MQTVYSAYYTSGNSGARNAPDIHYKRKDYLIRAQRRTPYDDGSRNISGGNRGKKPSAGILYMIITILLLVVLYPVGLILLWGRRLRWNVGVKLLLTVVTAILFCMMTVFALNYDTGNPTVERVQTGIRGVLETINQYTGNSVQKAVDWSVQQYGTGKENLLKIWDTVDSYVAEKALALYSHVDDNIYAAKVHLPTILLDEYKELTEYKDPDEGKEPAVKKATPDSGISVQLTKKPEVTPVPTPAPYAGQVLIQKVTPSPAPFEAPAGTPAPENTTAMETEPVSEPTPEPITLPKIKDVAKAPVYYTPNGTYYHLTSNCSNMVNANKRTLEDAKKAGKQVCDVCGVTSYAMMDSENYLWVTSEKIAHTTNDCDNFKTVRYSVLPFEDIYNKNYQYCELCGADICHRYMEQNHTKYAVGYDIEDENTMRLYDFERTITVYYSEYSRQYHATLECQYMSGEKYYHTLYQALHVDGKQRCLKCNAPTEEDALYQMSAANNN